MNKPKYTKIVKKSDVVKIFPKDFLPINENENAIKLYFKAIKVSRNTKTHNFPKLMRFFSLFQLANFTLKNKRIFDFVECGCWKGHSTFMISTLIKKRKKNVKFHIFDSFEGLSKSTKNDKIYHSKNKTEKERIEKYFKSNENFVKNKVLGSFNFTKTYKGWIPERFSEIKNKKFSFIHIDVDLYKPTLDCLKFFYPRLVKGGVIVCDDYNVTGFPGAKVAWDEFFKGKKNQFFFQNPLGGCYLIK